MKFKVSKGRYYPLLTQTSGEQFLIMGKFYDTIKASIWKYQNVWVRVAKRFSKLQT